MAKEVEKLEGDLSHIKDCFCEEKLIHNGVDHEEKLTLLKTALVEKVTELVKDWLKKVTDIDTWAKSTIDQLMKKFSHEKVYIEVCLIQLIVYSELSLERNLIKKCIL